MANGRFIAYYRVSTAKQGRSGLGLEAQREAVSRYLNGGAWTLIAEFTEVESGRKNERPQLAAAIERCKRTGSKLVIAKLDRLARNVAFIATLMESGVPFVAVDRPDAKPFELHIHAALAEEEARAISARTVAALAAAKARGTVLGGVRKNHRPVDSRLGAAAAHASAIAFARGVLPTIVALQEEGRSLRQVAAALNEGAVQTRAGGTWSATQVSRVLAASQA
ncbi:recombinase family protein [Lichenicoccus sp.]|uniref:recombinase family protein n=1 Tax=Lichenicoccus sp. TaxID=2781899 RepID=UPI003D12D291